MNGVAVFALTGGGARTARRLAELLHGALWLPAHLPESADHRFERVGPALRDAFGGAAALVCVMAAGIVVRSLAPVVADKKTDPAVLVVDEGGLFFVPLLSGHEGGANALAGALAGALGGKAVLTTSSDSQGLLGPDLLARALQARALDPARFLPVAAALVNGRAPELLYDPTEVCGATAFLEGLAGYRTRIFSGLPDAVAEDTVVVSPRALAGAGSDGEAQEWPGPGLRLVPRWVVAGLGCKRGAPGEALVLAVRQAFQEAGLHPAALRALASVRAKEEEPGLRVAGEILGVPVLFGSDEALREQIALRGLAESEWVRRHIGLGAACEPAALWAAGEGSRLVLPKRAAGGVTVALALADGGLILRSGEERWDL
ncbi:MAG: cobalamin biosynthesis protein [Thermoleophilia bacterium]|nr:cobalamin biosynthesis protein [Thermoleophilia bacterium]